MSVTITLPNDLEKFLKTHAHSTGVPLETLLEQTIVERWDGIRRSPTLSDRESELRLRLQTLFPPEETREYRELCERSDTGTITDLDRERLLALIDRRDHQNAERLELVGELANLYGVSVRAMMAQLGIRPE